MSSERFASLNEAELEQITDSRLSQSTKNVTKNAVKTFRSYLQVNLNTATNSCSFYMQCIHGIVLLHLFRKKNEYGVNVHEPQSMKYNVIIKQRNGTFVTGLVSIESDVIK